MQDTQNLKAQIVALLDFLPADSLKLLAEFAAFLRAKTDSSISSSAQKGTNVVELESMIKSRPKPIRISSPHLVKREQIAGFKLEIIEEATND